MLDRRTRVGDSAGFAGQTFHVSSHVKANVLLLNISVYEPVGESS
jgi:hypothetical protein